MYNKILKQLKELSEEKYKEFNKKIIPTNQKVLGVKIPELRKLAKSIAKDEKESLKFIEIDKKNIYEMVLLEGMVLANLNKSFLELLPLTENFLSKVDNWAQIDTSIADYKNIRKEKKEVLQVIKKWLKSDNEFVVRAGLVILLAHYIEEYYLNTIFDLSQKVKHKGYYVKMGNAWLISACMAKFPEETINFFQNNKLDTETQNKAIQKSRESRRVSKENKELILRFKK
ncbi:MAG: DNA alkylation repair protein [Ignavibacteriae bacterium]|nr:MAG: DNA alkylation repair protein [Ignavibacteriota bacterium]